MSALSQEVSAAGKLSLSSLVSYLLTAKRSLNCAEQLSRANEIVTLTRQSLVQQTAVNASIDFLLSESSTQVRIIEHLHKQLQCILNEAADEAAHVTRSVEMAQGRLDSTLGGLGNTTVDSKLRPPGEEPRTLLDFVERNSVQALLEEVYEGVKIAQHARERFCEILECLREDISGVQHFLHRTKSAEDDHQLAALPTLLQTLEISAHDMAQNFESLVRHYDLCLSALRHIEGAEAALSQSPNNDLSADQNAALVQAIEATEQSVSVEDRTSILNLVSEDAQQVEEVTADIRQALADMESNLVVVLTSVGRTVGNYQQAVSTFNDLDSIGSKLSQYTAQAHLFVSGVGEDKTRVAEQQLRLDELTDFYAGFLRAYDNLIVEVGRRKDVARRMKRVQEEALAKLDQFYYEDVEERNLFKANQGEFLPVDIWPGLMAPAPRYDIGIVEGDGSVPDISASTVQRAIRRVSARSNDRD